jgi:hypothetical protein
MGKKIDLTNKIFNRLTCKWSNDKDQANNRRVGK